MFFLENWFLLRNIFLSGFWLKFTGNLNLNIAYFVCFQELLGTSSKFANRKCCINMVKRYLSTIPINKLIEVQLGKSDSLIVPGIKNKKPLFFDIKQIILEVFRWHYHCILHLCWQQASHFLCILDSENYSISDVAPKFDFYLCLLLCKMWFQPNHFSYLDVEMALDLLDVFV